MKNVIQRTYGFRRDTKEVPTWLVTAVVNALGDEFVNNSTTHKWIVTITQMEDSAE